MIRRYDMSKSDNFPICSIIEQICLDSNGKIFIRTNHPISSAVVSPISVPNEGQIFADLNFKQRKDGFYIIYNNIPIGSIIKFSYQAQ